MIINCDICGKEFQIYPKRYRESATHCCSRECKSKALKSNDLNCECQVCGKKFHLKQSQLIKSEKHCCSRECFAKLKKVTCQGAGNHQYGLRGKENSSWKGGIKETTYGYIIEYAPNHPFANSDGNVFQHRLVADKYLLNENNRVEIDGKYYLSPEYIVHHKDGDKKNNDVSNLEIMTKSDHTKMHNQQQVIERDSKGKFVHVGVVKPRDKAGRLNDQ